MPSSKYEPIEVTIKRGEFQVQFEVDTVDDIRKVTSLKFVDLLAGVCSNITDRVLSASAILNTNERTIWRQIKKKSLTK